MTVASLSAVGMRDQAVRRPNELNEFTMAQQAFLNSCSGAVWISAEQRHEIRWLLSASIEHRRSIIVDKTKSERKLFWLSMMELAERNLSGVDDIGKPVRQPGDDHLCVAGISRRIGRRRTHLRGSAAEVDRRAHQ